MSAFQVQLGPSAAKAFSALDPRVQDRLRRALEKLANEAAKPGRIAGKSVRSIRGADDTFHRLRVGDLRVMYDVIPQDRVVLVLGIVHRAALERWLRRR